MENMTRLRILFSQRSLTDPTNPYSHLLFDSLGPLVDVVPFSWKKALLSRYDVLHLQWPEYAVRETTLSRRILNYLLVEALSVRIRLRRTPVVETVHNLQPHDVASPIERRSVRSLRSLVTRNIYLNNSSENDLSKGSVILHGNYEEILNQLSEPRSLDLSRYFLFFGLIRPYKGMERLIAAFEKYTGPVERLVIAGNPIDESYKRTLETLAARDPRIDLDLRHVPEDTLHGLVANAEAVILPYNYMYNSGALIYALSAGTPVLAPASPANDAIKAEVGEQWLRTFKDEILPDDLRHIARSIYTAKDGSKPDLSRRTWPDVAEQHLAVYQQVIPR